MVGRRRTIDPREDHTMKFILSLGALALLAPAPMAAGQGPARQKAARPDVTRGENHVIFRVKTPLQRLLTRQGVPSLFVAVNGAGCYDKKEFAPATLEALRRDLSRTTSAGDVVRFSIFFGEGSDGLDPKPLQEALGNLAGELALVADPNRMEMRNDNLSWKQKLAQMDEGLPAAGAPGDEEGDGDGETTVYPVRTHLSRYLTGADAYIELRGSSHGDARSGMDAPETIRTSVAKLKFARKKRISFHFYTLPTMDSNERRRLMKTLETFTRSLGFENFLLSVGG
jgi:hypothetical protein